MTGRIVRSTDFERVLRVPPRAKSAHFALHHLRGAPSRFVRKRASAATDSAIPVPSVTELSTGAVINSPKPVDDLPQAVFDGASWLGTVVPKRHARRSVTRSLMKRQMHAAFDRESRLPGGLWVLRLRSGFSVKLFPSAASDVLRRSVREELDGLLAGLVRKLQVPERVA